MVFHGFQNYEIPWFAYLCFSLKFLFSLTCIWTHHEYHFDFRCILKFLLAMVLFWDVAIQKRFLTSIWKQLVGKFWPGFLPSLMDICILVMPRYAACDIIIWTSDKLFFPLIYCFKFKQLCLRRCLLILGWQKTEMEVATWGVHFFFFLFIILLANQCLFGWKS